MPSAVTPDPTNLSKQKNALTARKNFSTILLSFSQAFRFFNDENYRKNLLLRCLYIFLTALFAFSIFTTVSDSFWLRYISPITTGLTPIGKISGKAGTSLRKTRADSLWLPVNSASLIFNSDILSTEKDSHVEIEMTKDLRITIEPKSLVRLRMQDGKPLLRLSKGEIKTNFIDDQVVLIKRGPRIEEILIRKGTYLIKNDMSAGIQITTFTQEMNSLPGVKEEKRTQSKMKDDSVEETNSSAKKQKETEESGNQLSYDLPTPRDNTLFLLKSPQSILVAAKITCPDKCKLTLYRDNHEFKTYNWNHDESSIVRLEPEEALPGLYSWIYSSQNFEHKSTFTIQEFSETALGKAIENSQPIEILDTVAP